jgi:hypothetical protein
LQHGNTTLVVRDPQSKRVPKKRQVGHKRFFESRSINLDGYCIKRLCTLQYKVLGNLEEKRKMNRARVAGNAEWQLRVHFGKALIESFGDAGFIQRPVCGSYRAF